jgi:hypothetical protein
MPGFRGFLRLLILAASAWAVLGLISEEAAADELTDQWRFIQLINQDRAAHGLPPVQVDNSLVIVAGTHSARMASAGTIFHNSNLAHEVSGGWAMLGENVGVGGGVDSLHQAFMNSGSHRENVLGSFDRAGVGVVMSGSTMYVTEVFWKSASTQGSGYEHSPNDSIEVFVRGIDDQLYHKTWNGYAWSDFSPLGGVLTSDPASVSWANGRIDVFVRGADNGLWHKWFAGGAWSGWESLGGVLASAPDVSSWGPNRLDVFAMGSDNQLWHRWWNGAAWQGWEPLGGELASGPGAVSWGANRIDIFVKGADSQLWHKWWDGSAWKGYEPLGGFLTSNPKPSSWAHNRLDVFVKGADNQLWHRFWDGSAWHGFERHEGVLTASPGAVSKRLGRIDVFVRGTDAGLWHKWFNGNWSGWEPLGGHVK